MLYVTMYQTVRKLHVSKMSMTEMRKAVATEDKDCFR